MLFYSIIVSFLILLDVSCCFLFKKKDKLKKIFKIALISVLFIFISSFKSLNTGTDTIVYYNFYIKCQNDSWNNVFKTGFEPLYSLFNFVFSKTNIDFCYFLLFLYIIIYFGIALFSYKFSNNVTIFYLSFIAFKSLMFNMSALRQAVAISIILIGVCIYASSIKFKTVCFIFLTILASLFHQTAILSIAIIPASKIKYSFKTLLIMISLLTSLLIVSPALYSCIVGLFPNLGYAPVDQKTPNLVFGCFFAFVLFSIIIIDCNKYLKRVFNYDLIIRDINKNVYLNNILFLACIFFCLSTATGILGRISYYYIFSLYSLVSNYLDSIKNKKTRFIFICLFILFVFIMLFKASKINYLQTFDYSLYW